MDGSYHIIQYKFLDEHHEPSYGCDEHHINTGLKNISNKLNIPLVATGNVHYLTPEDAPLHDVLTCIRHRLSLERAINYLRTNHEYYFHYSGMVKVMPQKC